MKFRIGLFVHKDDPHIHIHTDGENHYLEFDSRFLWELIKEKQYNKDMPQSLREEIIGACLVERNQKEYVG